MSELHPELEAFLRERDARNVPPMNALSVAAAREQHRRTVTTDGGPTVAETHDLSILGPEGDVPLRIYRPSADGALPVLLWFHGGGFVLGDVESDDALCRVLANEADCLVVSVDYRLAPEHPFPAAPKDCYAALRWTAEYVAEFGGDPSRVAVGGGSAGGNLAAVTALQARDRGGPSLVHQLLVYPITAAETLPARRENAEGYGLTDEDVRWFEEQYVRDAVDAAHPYAYPLRANDLSGLPAATVLTAEFDPLRDDGVRYARRLDAAGVETTHRNYDDAIHGFFGMVSDPDLDRAREAIADAAADLGRSFE